MTDKNADKKKTMILVTGDVIVDHHIYKGQREAPHMAKPGTTIAECLGGAALLHEIIDKTFALAGGDKSAGYEVRLGLKTESAGKLPSDHHSYAVWAPCAKDTKDKGEVWRMTEPMGYGGGAATGEVCQALPSALDKVDPEILVIDDGGLGFRFCKHDDWSKFLNGAATKKLQWVVLKTAGPVAQGDLWRTLSGKFMDRLVVVVSVRDIRREEAGITQGLSWERTAQDLLTELKFNASISDLLKCRHLIVGFGSEGALWVDNDAEAGSRYHLVYDSAHLEGEWSRNYTGQVFGYNSCLTAGIVSRLAGLPAETDFGKGIIAGLATMRVVHTVGHGEVSHGQPGFPFAEAAKSILNPKTDSFSLVDVPPPPEKIDSVPVRWEIIEGARAKGKAAATPLYSQARRVALFGTKALSNIPYVSFNKLFTVDRSEMESLRGIERLVKNYAANKKAPRPLSIGVFGPPGSGKSFGIKQIAGAILGKDAAILEFNLSQFERPEDLIGPLHQVRDEALSGKVPVVFWDEFDSRENFWLQYLLAPMQDGKFREGLMSHPIGKCVFVFAGGTSRTMENFTPDRDDNDLSRRFALQKGPDFVSRLAGYLNVLGPNRRQRFDKKKKEWVDDDIHADICFPVRRALLLRNMLGLGKDNELQIDKGLLNAILEIEEYNHGARSLETIATLTKGAKSGGLMRSDLPPEEQMAIHVDYARFMNIIKRDLPFKLHAEVLAPAIHEFYRRLCKKNGWEVKYDLDYDKLPDNIKSDNIAAATRLPEVLYLAGLKVVPKGQPVRLTGPEILANIEDGIEIMAEAEHNGWMDYKILNGWTLGERNDAKKRHNLLIPYRDLSDREKEKDRDAVRNYPEIVALAGYKICGIK